MAFPKGSLDDVCFIGDFEFNPKALPFSKILKHHEKVRDATASIIHLEHLLEPDLHTFVTIQSFIYAFNAYKAVGLLLPEQYHESSSVILRQLWEVSLNMHWLELDPENRSQDFCNFTLMEQRKNLQKKVVNAEDIDSYDKATSRFQSRFRYRDVKGRERRHNEFAKKSVCDRAEELGDTWKSEYSIVYHLASMHAHGSPGAILHGFFRQHYNSPRILERNSSSLIALVSMKVLVRDVELLVRLNIIESRKVVDEAYEEVKAILR